MKVIPCTPDSARLQGHCSIGIVRAQDLKRRSLTATVRVLLVDDYEPWRQFVCSALQKRPELEIVGEVADGLEAVQQAGELQSSLTSDYQP